MKLALLLKLAVGLFFSSALALASACELSTEKAQVSAVYPTADTLPENLLRFYIYFSKPMVREKIQSHVYLADEKGNKLQGVFLDNKFDLWSPDSTRLTVLFDPGRVKTGLVAHNAMGRALKPGSSYQLIIAASTKDAEGCTMGDSFRKYFKASEADYEAPDVAKWNINNPTKGTLQALKVDVNGLMDHVSMAYRIRVKDATGHVVAGNIELAMQEQQWIFNPDQPWNEGPYKLLVDPVLEDVAGNRVTGLFDQPSLARESASKNKWIEIDI